MRPRTLVSAASFAAAVLGTLAGTPRVARAADEVRASRFDVVEREHAVDARVGRGALRLVVQRTVMNPGPKSDQTTFMLDVPEQAVATRLRTSSVDAQGHLTWFEGELLEAEEAARRYKELTGLGGAYPKDPALLSWRRRGQLALQVFPVPPQGAKTVEYTLTMPLAYANGTYKAELPPLGTDELPATVRLSTEHAGDVLRVNGVAPPRDGLRASRPLTIELTPRAAPQVDGAVASVRIGPSKHLVRARIAAAPRLGEVPASAHVVVLFDASRSVRDPAAALASVRAYLWAMRGATVDFLAFDREVRTPIGPAQPVDAALAKLQGLALEPRNGSRIEVALARADAILRASSATARRVLLVTDTLTRSAMPAATIGAMAWTSGALVHAANVTSGGDALERDDASPWAALPRRTGGLFWLASSQGSVDGRSRAVFEEWARPKRIQRLVVVGLTGGFALADDALLEGAGLEHLAIADVPTTTVRVTGELWSRPVAATFTPTDDQARLAAALVFGDPVSDALDDAEQMVLARRGGAVSPVTSYLAIEPGVRPSIDGLEPEWGIGGLGLSGTGGGTSRGVGSGGARRPAFDHDAFLAGELRRAAAACGIGGRRVSVRVETTYDEIVDLGDVTFDTATDARASACVAEAMWKATLTSAFDAERRSFDVSAAL